jgi:hypothetical protein
MNRRMALWMTLLSGGILPARLMAQTSGTRVRDDDRAGFRKAAAPAPTRPPRGRATEDDPQPDDTDSPAVEGDPADFPDEPGHVWRTWDISHYTGLPHSAEESQPQNSIVEWILRRTGSAKWHGEKLAALSASRTQIRAYHDPKTLKVVDEVVTRFTKQPGPDVLRVHVRFVAAADPRWRYLVFNRLTPIMSGPQGQQVWAIKVEDAAMVRSQMAIYQGFKLLGDQEIKMVNGQTLQVKTLEDVGYISGAVRDAAGGFGLQPGVSQLKEGVILRLSPLLNYEGDQVDVAMELTANTVKGLHRTKILARRDIGSPDLTIDVPEVVETRLNQTVQGWEIGKSLLISAGIHPGILQSKTGFLNLRIPGTVPTNTELLVFLDIELVNTTPRTARRRD